MEIKDFKSRLYQEKIFSIAANSNTLVILPTGLGKTFIALMLAVHRVNIFPDSKVLFMAPTKPLCDQHMKTFAKHLAKTDDEDFSLVTGLTKPEDRKKLYRKQFIFATPQTIANDVKTKRLSLKEFSLVIFDEAHRAIGEYDYVYTAKQYREQGRYPRILALTASPGSDKTTIMSVCDNLFITSVEIRDEQSTDVIEHVQSKNIEKIMIDLPDGLKEIMTLFEKSLKRRLDILKSSRLIQNSEVSKVRKSQLLMLQKSLSAKAKGNWYLMKNISVIAACIKIMHCLELLQSQGIKPLASFLISLKEQAERTKAAKGLIEDLEFNEGMQKVFQLESQNIEHPKYYKLVELVKKNIKPNSKIIIFTQYRNTADQIISFIKNVKDAAPVRFIGQKSGMSQREQLQTLDDFKDGIYNILVCTSIGEEGLHIENANLGIFFEPVPSALRSIQRRGRIGRVNFGKIVLLITKNTIDEKYYWVSFHKEKRMKDAIRKVQDDMESPQKRLKRFLDD